MFSRAAPVVAHDAARFAQRCAAAGYSSLPGGLTLHQALCVPGVPPHLHQALRSDAELRLSGEEAKTTRRREGLLVRGEQKLPKSLSVAVASLVVTNAARPHA